MAFVVPFGVFAWLSVTSGTLADRIVLVAWGILLVATIVRVFRLRPGDSRKRAVAGPIVDSVGEMQNIYLGRPDLDPVSFGHDGPAATELVVEPLPHDPGDLREPGR